MSRSALSLRLVCALAPYAIAGVRFGRGVSRAYGVAVLPADRFDAGQLRQLFADPSIDVSAGCLDGGFLPVVDELDLGQVVQRFEAAIRQSVTDATTGWFLGPVDGSGGKLTSETVQEIYRSVLGVRPEEAAPAVPSPRRDTIAILTEHSAKLAAIEQNTTQPTTEVGGQPVPLDQAIAQAAAPEASAFVGEPSVSGGPHLDSEAGLTPEARVQDAPPATVPAEVETVIANAKTPKGATIKVGGKPKS